jgi:hypothetical protein
MPAPELDLLKERFEEQRMVYRDCAAQTADLSWPTRLLVQTWLAEIHLMLARLERQLVQLSIGTSPVGLESAWKRYLDILTALSPVTIRRQTADGSEFGSVEVGAVGWRLQIVMLFLLLQLGAALGLLGWTVRTFGSSDPQTTLTREQWEERAHARAEVRRMRSTLEQAGREAAAAAPPAAPAPAPGTPPAPEPAVPDASQLRAQVEGVAATLASIRLAERDLRLANRYLENVLEAMDKPDYVESARLLQELETALGGDVTDAPPSPIRLIILGSLLGMLTITIHLNWKYRNRWDTIGFLPWYLTRLLAAPVISLALLGLLFQVSFTTDLTTSENFTSLGLRGAAPLTIFAVAIVSGLFSNLAFDWLRALIVGQATAATRPPSRTTEPTPPPEE